MCKYVQDTYLYTYRIRSCTYVILTCQYRILTFQYLILTFQYHIRTVSVGQYLHVSAHILRNASLLLLPTSICSPALTCAPARGRCTFAWAQVRRAVAAASPSRGQRGRRRIINKFIQIRFARLDSGSRRQLEQQQLCCALKCLGAVGCQWSTSRRQRNNIDEQNNNSSRSIRRPLLRKRSWISRSTYVPKSKHRKSTQTSKTMLK